MPFMGMRGTGDWVANSRPENWRQGILRMYPNGKAPLTAIMSMMPSQPTDDPVFHWWTKMLASQRSTVTGIYTENTLNSAYTSGGAAGDTLYVKMAEAEIDKYDTTYQVLLRASTDLSVDVNAKVTATHKNGASSYLTVRLLEADDNGSGHDLSDSDVCLIIGNINSEGSGSPNSILTDPFELSNQVQISKTPFEHTGTAMQTNLRWGDPMKEAQREALELHGLQMERGSIFGKKQTVTGTNGKPERSSDGIRQFITTNRFNFKTDGGGTWLSKGESWMDTKLEQIFRYGSDQKLFLCGSGFLLGIQNLAKANGHFELTSATESYGIRVLKWVTAFGEVNFKTHPLFSEEATLRNSALQIEPKNLVYRPMKGRDTRLQPNIQAPDVDGRKDQYMTEAGYETHLEQTHSWWDSVGVDA